MVRSLRALRTLAARAVDAALLRRARDERNIRRLARHEHCSLADARRLYFLARQQGYGAAHEAVFGRRGDALRAERARSEASVAEPAVRYAGSGAAAAGAAAAGAGVEEP